MSLSQRKAAFLKAVFQRTSIPVKNRADAEQSFDCRKRVDFFQLPVSRAGIRSIAAGCRSCGSVDAGIEAASYSSGMIGSVRRAG